MTRGPRYPLGWGCYTRYSVVLTGLLLTAAAPVTGQSPKVQPLSVYVFTAETEGGFVDADSKQRADSVRDLREALRKKKTVIVVESSDDADLLVEVLRRGLDETGKTSTKTSAGLGGLYSTTTKDTEAMVRTKLTVGEYSTEIVGKNDGRITNVWRTAANNAANQIDKWINANRDRVRQSKAKQQ